MEVTGFVKKIFDTKQVSETFTTREIWVETAEQYPQTLNIQFTQDSCSYLDNYKEGDKVNISVNLRGRLWENPEGIEKVFNSVQGWRIFKDEQSAPEPTPPPVDMNAEDESELPF